MLADRPAWGSPLQGIGQPRDKSLKAAQQAILAARFFQVTRPARTGVCGRVFVHTQYLQPFAETFDQQRGLRAMQLDWPRGGKRWRR